MSANLVNFNAIESHHLSKTIVFPQSFLTFYIAYIQSFSTSKYVFTCCSIFAFPLNQFQRSLLRDPVFPNKFFEKLYNHDSIAL